MFEKIIEKIKTLKKGAFHVFVYKHEGNGYVKTTKVVGRLCNYYHTKSFKESGRTPSGKTNPNVEVIVPHALTYNKNTKNHLLQVQITNHHKFNSTYARPNGEPCDSKEFYEMSGRTPSGKTNIINIKLQDLVSID